MKSFLRRLSWTVTSGRDLQLTFPSFVESAWRRIQSDMKKRGKRRCVSPLQGSSSSLSVFPRWNGETHSLIVLGLSFCASSWSRKSSSNPVVRCCSISVASKRVCIIESCFSAPQHTHTSTHRHSLDCCLLFRRGVFFFFLHRKQLQIRWKKNGMKCHHQSRQMRT